MIKRLALGEQTFPKLNKVRMEKTVKRIYLNFSLQATLSSEEGGAVWVVEHYKGGKLVC